MATLHYSEGVVRRLEISDGALFRLIRLSALRNAPEAFGSVFAVAASEPLATFVDTLREHLVLGAFDDDQIVGMIGFRRESGAKDKHKGLIWGFYVEPEHRGRGFGTALIAAALDTAKATVEQVMLSVTADNVAALTLYELFGFERYGREPRALKSADGYTDEVLMWRPFRQVTPPS